MAIEYLLSPVGLLLTISLTLNIVLLAKAVRRFRDKVEAKQAATKEAST